MSKISAFLRPPGINAKKLFFTFLGYMILEKVLKTRNLFP